MEKQTIALAPQYDAQDCNDFRQAISRTLDIVGGKWKVPLLWLLWHRKQRFNELRQALPDITQHMLTASLREMEADGLVSRAVFAEVPPRVEYALTEQGRSLESVLIALGEWGKKAGPRA
jgi:DNA-binding HxlR family transcriptional regulator